MKDWRSALREQLIEHEGLSLKPYRDTVGKLTIGVGRNLDDVGITGGEALLLLDNDIERTMRALDQGLPAWSTHDTVRRRVLVDMAFNMGIGGLLKFSHTLAALEKRDYAGAAAEMERSLWFQQTGKRARKLVAMMRDGAADSESET